MHHKNNTNTSNTSSIFINTIISTMAPRRVTSTPASATTDASNTNDESNEATMNEQQQNMQRLMTEQAQQSQRLDGLNDEIYRIEDQLHMLHNTLTDLVSAIHNQNTANTNASNAASNENNASSASNVRTSNTSTNVMNTSNNTSTSNVPDVPSVLVQPIQRSSSSQSLNRIQYVHENERRPTPFNPRRVYDPERNVLLTQEDVAAFGSVNSNNITEAETRCFLSRLERHLSNDPHDNRSFYVKHMR